MTEVIAVLAVVVPCVALALAFFVKAGRSEGLDRRKYNVGGIMFLMSAVLASFVAWTLVALGPPGS